MSPVLICFLINDLGFFAKPLPVAGVSENKSHPTQQSKLTINLFGGGGVKEKKKKNAENFHLYYPQNEMWSFFPIPEFQKNYYQNLLLEG